MIWLLRECVCQQKNYIENLKTTNWFIWLLNWSSIQMKLLFNITTHFLLLISKKPSRKIKPTNWMEKEMKMKNTKPTPIDCLFVLIFSLSLNSKFVQLLCRIVVYTLRSFGQSFRWASDLLISKTIWMTKWNRISTKRDKKNVRNTITSSRNIPSKTILGMILIKHLHKKGWKLIFTLKLNWYCWGNAWTAQRKKMKFFGLWKIEKRKFSLTPLCA